MLEQRKELNSELEKLKKSKGNEDEIAKLERKIKGAEESIIEEAVLLVVGQDMGRRYNFSKWAIEEGKSLQEAIQVLNNRKEILPAAKMFVGKLDLNDPNDMGKLAGLEETMRQNKLTVQKWSTILILSREVANVHNKAFPEDRMDLSTSDGMGRAIAEFVMVVKNGLTFKTLPVFYELKKPVIRVVDRFIEETEQLTGEKLRNLRLDRDNLPDEKLLKLTNKSEEKLKEEGLGTPLTDEERSRLIPGIIDGRYIGYIKYMILKRSGVDLGWLYSDETPQEIREEEERKALRDVLPKIKEAEIREMIEQLTEYLERLKIAATILGVSPNPGIMTYGDAAYWAERFMDKEIEEMRAYLENLNFIQSAQIRELLSRYYELLGQKVDLDPATKASKGIYGFWLDYMHKEFMPQGKKLKDLTPVEIKHMRNQMVEELELRNRGIVATNKYWKRLEEDKISYYVKVFRKLREKYPNLTIETMFRNIGEAQRVRQKEGGKLLEELRQAKLEPWETREERQEMIRHIEVLKEQEVTDEEAVHLGTVYLLENGYGPDDLAEDTRMEMYWQALYMTHNKESRKVDGKVITKPMRLEQGKLGDLRSGLKSDLAYFKEEKEEDKKAKRDELVKSVGRSIKYSAIFERIAKERLPQLIRNELKTLAEKLEKPELQLPLEKVRELHPTQNVWDVIGYVSRMGQQGWDEKKMEADFPDLGWLQAVEYASEGKFLRWEGLFTNLYQVRSKDDKPLEWFEKWKEERRFQKGTYKEDLGFMNLGEEGERLSHLFSAWLTHFGEVLGEERMQEKLSQLQNLEERLLESGVSQGEIWTKKSELIGRLGGVYRSFVNLVASPIYTHISTGKDIEEGLKENLIELDKHITPQLIDFIANGRAKRDEAKENIREKYGLGGEVLYNYRATIAEERQKRARALAERLARPGESERLAKELVEKAKSDYGLDLAKDLADYYVKKMAENGYSQDEVIFRHVYLPHRVAKIYREVYKKDNLSKDENYVVNAIAEPIADRVIFKFSSQREEIEKEWRARKTEELKWQRAKPGLSPKREDYLEGRLREVDKWTPDVQLENELEKLREELELAVHIETEFKKAGVAMDSQKARLTATRAHEGCRTEQDITDWAKRVILLKELGGRAGIEITDELMDRIVFITDSWFELGLAKEPKIAIDEPALKTAVEEQFRRLGIPEAEISSSISDVVALMAGKKMQPVDIKLPADRVSRIRRVINKAADENRRRSRVSERTRALSKTYDLTLSLTDKDLLVLLDYSNIDYTKKIGLAEIFGYSGDYIENHIARPLTATYKHMIEDRLREELSSERTWKESTWREILSDIRDEVIRAVEKSIKSSVIFHRRVQKFIPRWIEMKLDALKEHYKRVIPSAIWQKSWSWAEKTRYRVWKDFGWGNMHTWRFIVVLVGVVDFIRRLMNKWRTDEKLAPGLKWSYREIFFLWANTVLTAALVTFIMLGLNYSFFSGSSVILWGVTLFYLLAIMPDKYLLSVVVRFGVEPLYKLFTGKSLLEPYSKEELDRIPDEDKMMVSIGFPIRIKPGVDIEDMENADGIKNYAFVLGRYGEPKPKKEGEAVRLLRQAVNNNDSNLYYSVVLQVQHEKQYKLIKEDLEKKLEAMDPAIRKRLYIFMVLLEDEALVPDINKRKRVRLIKPYTHYKLLRWLMEGKDDYRKVSPDYNTEIPGEEMTLPFKDKDILGGDPSDRNDLRNIRKRNVRSAKDLADRRNEIRYTLVYDPGNMIEYEGLKKLVSVMADERNKEIMYIGKYRYYHENATLYSKVMKYFPQEMLKYTQEAMYIIFRSLRAPGKYAYRNDEYYRRMPKSYAYEKTWPLGDRKSAKSEDEINTIICGRVKYVPDVVIKEDPMYNYPQEWERERDKWATKFDIPNAEILRLMPYIRDHPLRVAAIVGALPAFTICALLDGGISLPTITTLLMSGLAAIVSMATLGMFMFRKDSKIIKALEEDGVMEIPKLSPSHKYESNMVIRGLISEVVWSIQLLLTFKAMLFPGTLETLFPYISGFAYTTIMLLLIHPKFHPSLKAFYISISSIFNPGKKYELLGKEVTGPKALVLVPGYILIAVLELACSTGVFLTKIVMKPPVVIISFIKTHKILHKQLLEPEDYTRETRAWGAQEAPKENPLFVKHLWEFKTPFAIMILFLVLSYVFNIIPKELIWSAYSILIASFGCAAGWSWLSGRGKYEKDEYVEMPRRIGWSAYILGGVVLVAGILATFFFPEVVQKMLWIVGVVIPQADGSIYMYWFSYQAQLNLPWWVVIFAATIVAGGIVIGGLASIWGLIHDAKYYLSRNKKAPPQKKLSDEGGGAGRHGPSPGKKDGPEEPPAGRNPGRFGKGRFGPRALPGSANVEFLEKIVEVVKRLVKAIGRSVRLFALEKYVVKTSGEEELRVKRAEEIKEKIRPLLAEGQRKNSDRIEELVVEFNSLVTREEVEALRVALERKEIDIREVRDLLFRMT
ncbi:hypothetical protein MUO65_02080, partial [bacterium]|nr:hypothetical protein [bacterium]